MNILAGVIGAVVGFLAGVSLFALAGLDNSADPIASGMIALLVFGPAGAVGGVFLSIWLTMRLRGQIAPAASGGPAGGDQAMADIAPAAAGAAPSTVATPSVTKTGLKAIGTVVVVVAVIGGLWAWYEIATATPWLRPANVVLQFELRLPPAAPMPEARDIAVELQTDLNTMPGNLRGDGVRRDSDRVVIAGEVDLAFRTPNRQLEVRIKGQPDRLHRIGLKATAPHSPELGPWQRHIDGSEIRYRAKWPGQP